jgi:single-stranded DNA-binding protein
MGESNRVIMLGNLTRHPDLRYTPSGMPVCEFPPRGFIMVTG